MEELIIHPGLSGLSDRGAVGVREPHLEIDTLWERAEFAPNPEQREAILHVDGPLFLTAGPGSGKTRVLLWRTLNLIVFCEVSPDEIFLGTFTEKAALQLRQGLTAYLSEATRLTGRPYDISRMFVGTVHSICRRILSDRRFSPSRMRPESLRLADELDQYFFLLTNWNELVDTAAFGPDANRTINKFLTGKNSNSRHGAVAAVISLFNRLSEECIDPERGLRLTRDPVLKPLLRMYAAYTAKNLTDLSRLQKAALDHCNSSEESGSVLRHVIIDEYQDTNHVQEQLFFRLTARHRNLCVVGDDDQALYRFRGSTVENLVEFEERCAGKLNIRPRRINLGTNYRSRRLIVDFYSKFIEETDWRKGRGKTGSYRVENKGIVAHSEDPGPAVVASTPGGPLTVCNEVATLVRRLIDEKKVSDPNEIAFLYPSLKSEQVHRMIEALANQGLKAYAPRAGHFLDVPEAVDVFGIFTVLFGRPEQGGSYGMQDFFDWISSANRQGRKLARENRRLAGFIKTRQDQIKQAVLDRQILIRCVGKGDLDSDLNDELVAGLSSVRGLSAKAAGYIHRGLRSLREARRRSNRRLTVKYVINRVTTLDWGVLDLFYELMQFGRFQSAFDEAQRGEDEGPICNLSLISQYLARFQAQQRNAVLSASFLENSNFVRTFFNSFLYALWRRGESEYEDAEDPFPKGRIPFLTVHQAKGLEFPVVVVGNPRKAETVQEVEKIVRPLLAQRQGEPLDRIGEFDVARMFYVALSRPKNLLVLCHYQGRGQHINREFQDLLDDNFKRIPELDLNDVPASTLEHATELPEAYSYTGDYLAYRSCPRRYMLYRRYNFAPARPQTMFFGTLVHRTVEDLHEWLRVNAQDRRRS